MRHFNAGGDPERLDVLNVVEHEPRRRVNFERVGGSGSWELPHLIVVGMKRQRNERLKAVRLILQRSQLQHVIDALLERFDVPVQHRDVRPHTHAVRRPVNAQITVGAATAGQCEIDIRYDTLVNAADSVQSYKYIVKNVAKKHDMIATMMPKPIALDNGSGMHVNVSLWKDNKNLFFDADDKYAEVSELARYFGGGVLDHASALAAIVAPTTNSYRRLVPGYEAPVYISWSTGNRSAIIRIPAHYRGEKFSAYKRLEFRAPDPSCNPYLAFSAIMAAGFDGVNKRTSIGDPINEDIFKMTSKRRSELGIKQLPTSLRDACEELRSDREFLKPIFSDDTIDTILEQEIKDYNEVAVRPHPHEFSMYADV